MGEYRRGEVTFSVRQRDGELYLSTPTTDEPEPLVAASGATFFRLHPRRVLKFVFERESDGTVTALRVLSGDGWEARLEKVD